MPVIFNNPEQVYELKIYPSYVITRTTPAEPALFRWHSVKQLEYKAGVSGTEEVVTPSGFGPPQQSVSGYGQLERKQQAWPVDIFYSIACYARYEHVAIPMTKRILQAFPLYSKINVVDSLGDVRTYTVFNESGIQDISEFVDVADRLKAYSVDVRVEAELDVVDPSVVNTTRGVDINFGKL